MAKERLLNPDSVRDLLTRRYANQHRLWLAGEGAWPINIALGTPSEKLAQQHMDAVRAWVLAWQSWQGAGTLEWCEYRWRTMGAQRLPQCLSLANAREIADWLGETARWQCASTRYQQLIGRWPTLENRLARHFDVLADYMESDFQCLQGLLGWLEANPASNLYPRQLPVPGLDSKWLERRNTLLVSLVSALHGREASGVNLFECCGLRPIQRLLRVRVLDPKLRKCTGGLSDISAPISDLAQLSLPVRRVFIVENTQTGLAFEDLSGAVVLMGLGYGVEALGQLPWMHESPCIYWGDLDTHGFAILSHARSFLPQIQSCLMDEETLLTHRAFWCEEKQQHPASELPRLTEGEMNIFHGLKEQRWGLNVRLEQERITWDTAWKELRFW